MGNPLEAALVVVAVKCELFDEHHGSKSNPARWPRSIPATAMLLVGFSASLHTKVSHRLRFGHARNSTTGLSRFFGNRWPTTSLRGCVILRLALLVCGKAC